MWIFLILFVFPIQVTPRFLELSTCKLDLCLDQITSLQNAFELQPSQEKECHEAIKCLTNLNCLPFERQKLVEIFSGACRIYPNKCVEMLTDLQYSVESTDDVESQLELCKEIKKSCAFSPVQQEMLEKSCDMLEFQKDPLTKCFQKLNLYSRFIKTQCMNGKHFLEFSKGAICADEMTSVHCLVGIIQKECGQAAAQSYEDNQVVLAEIYNC